MPATLTTNGGNTTLALSYTSSNANMLAVLGDAAEYFFNHGYGDHGTEESPITFGDLTNQQKADIILAAAKDTVVNAANTHKSIVAQDAARAAEAASEYTL